MRWLTGTIVALTQCCRYCLLTKNTPLDLTYGSGHSKSAGYGLHLTSYPDRQVPGSETELSAVLERVRRQAFRGQECGGSLPTGSRPRGLVTACLLVRKGLDPERSGGDCKCRAWGCGSGNQRTTAVDRSLRGNFEQARNEIHPQGSTIASLHMKRIAILGSTGSIGRSTLSVVETYPERFQVVALAAGRNVELPSSRPGAGSPGLISISTAVDAEILRSRLQTCRNKKC